LLWRKRSSGSTRGRDNCTRVPCSGEPRRRPARQLRRKCSRSGQCVVLPVDRAPRQRRQTAVRQLRDARERATDAHIPSGSPNEVEVLVEPDRHHRADTEDEAIRQTRLDLGQRPGTGLVHAVERTPAIRKVPVQVDAARVAPRVSRPAVGIQDRDDPEVNTRRRLACEQLRNADTRRLVAVDAADDEHRSAASVPSFDQWDRTALGRVAEQRRLRLCRRCDDNRQQDERQRAIETSRAPLAAPLRGSSVTYTRCADSAVVHRRQFAVRGRRVRVPRL
jgi:hypothetical protein